MSNPKDRKLKDWLTAYLEYCKNTESAVIFHKWVGLSCIAAALQRKVWFRFGMFKNYPNLYIVLVANPGVGRKTKAISIGRSFLENISGISISADVVASKQAFYTEFEKSRKEDCIGACNDFPTGMLTHCSLTLLSDEFETFLGEKGKNGELLASLTDFYDGKSTFEYSAKQAKNSSVVNLYLNLLAATTPSSLAQSFPTSAIGGGLSRRIMFVWAAEGAAPQPIPEAGSPDLFKLLESDLYRISTIAGELTFSHDSRQWWIDWYMQHRAEAPESRIATDSNFIGWYSVKPDLIQKVAMIVAASERHCKAIEISDFERAISIIEEAEAGMECAFQGVGRSIYSDDIKKVEDIVKTQKEISEEMLFQLIWKDIDQEKFDRFIYPTAKKKGTIKRKLLFKDSTGNITNKAIDSLGNPCTFHKTVYVWNGQ